MRQNVIRRLYAPTRGPQASWKTRAFAEGLDSPCLKLCEAMNAVPDIETCWSCCGHGKWPYAISFVARSLEAAGGFLRRLRVVQARDGHWLKRWRVDCEAASPGQPFGSPVVFTLQGPVGQSAYRQAVQLARALRRIRNLAAEERKSRKAIIRREGNRVHIGSKVTW